MASEYRKRYSASSAIREMQIKTIMRYHSTLTRMAIIKRTDSHKYWQGCGEIGNLINW